MNFLSFDPRLSISLDFDGTLVRTTDLVCNLINFRRGTSFTAKDVKAWAYWKDVGHDADFWAAYDFLDQNNLRLGLAPYDDGTTRVVNQLLFGGLPGGIATPRRVTVVTMNAPPAGPQIEAWLAKHALDRMEVICLGRPPSIVPAGTPPSNGGSKLDLPFQVYLDDSPGLALETQTRPDKFLLLANAPWNQEVADTANVRRFHRWHEIPSLLAEATAYFQARAESESQEAVI